jgi:hypothetical protein
LILSMLLCKTIFFIQCLYHELPPVSLVILHCVPGVPCSKSNSYYKFSIKVVLHLLPNGHSVASINKHLVSIPCA